MAERSTLVDVLAERVRPERAPLLVADRDAAVEAVRTGRVDATVVDLPVGRGLAASDPGALTVLGHLGDGPLER